MSVMVKYDLYFFSRKLGTMSRTLVITVSVATIIVSKPNRSIVMKNKMDHKGATGRVVTRYRTIYK